MAALTSAYATGAADEGAASDAAAGTRALRDDGDPRPSHPEPIVQPIRGRATRVHDGDSFALLTVDGRRLQIRVSGIDAPEKGQAFADRSRRHLSALLVQQDLLIAPIKNDVYGRVVAAVSADGQDVGLAQLRAGMAWHFRRYARDQSIEQRQAYARAEAQAREVRAGLWRDRDPLEPWLFREKQRDRKSGGSVPGRRGGNARGPPAPRTGVAQLPDGLVQHHAGGDRDVQAGNRTGHRYVHQRVAALPREPAKALALAPSTQATDPGSCCS